MYDTDGSEYFVYFLFDRVLPEQNNSIYTSFPLLIINENESTINNFLSRNTRCCSLFKAWYSKSDSVGSRGILNDIILDSCAHRYFSLSSELFCKVENSPQVNLSELRRKLCE